jgi:phospholipid:diacylglycerol acyltransferase
LYANFDTIFVLTFQPEHDGSDVQIDLNVEHHYEEDIVPNMTRLPRVKYITYYEDSESLPGKRTAVWELDKGACMTCT